MWNRLEHFEMLVDDLCEIYSQDPDIGLCVTDFCTPGANEVILKCQKQAPFPLHFRQREREFCNGLGHNIAARHAPDGCILAIAAVDLKMPPDITLTIRRWTQEGRKFYGPQIRYECQDGRLVSCRAAYALIGCFKSDFDRVGGMATNMKWGGDHRDGGEDIKLMKALKKRGLVERRKCHPALVSRWHPRNVEQTFYSRMPWWSLVDEDGEPVG
jgi:hypothetical protein